MPGLTERRTGPAPLGRARRGAADAGRAAPKLNLPKLGLSLLGVSMLAACGQQEAAGGVSSPRPTVPEAATTVLPPDTTAVPAPDCDVELLRQAAADYYPSARIHDEACLSTWAIGTLTSPRTDEAGLVVFFEGDGDRWTLLQVEPADSDVEAVAPIGFPGALLAAWSASYVPPTTTSTTTSTTTPPTPTTTGPPSTTEAPSTTETTATSEAPSTTETTSTTTGPSTTEVTEPLGGRRPTDTGPPRELRVVRRWR